MIRLETNHAILTLTETACAESLILKATGEDCLLHGQDIPIFAFTEDRPYNNEIKLSHPCKPTLFNANALRREGDRLIVGFEGVGFEAIIRLTLTDDYMAFSLEDFLIHPEDFAGLAMTPPPVREFRLLQLSLKDRGHFGEWLNVVFDDTAAINLSAADPFTRVATTPLQGGRLLYAAALQEVRLKNTTAALLTCPKERLMDVIDRFEQDYDLPRGAQSRRNQSALNASVYWTSYITPQNVDEHIRWAQKGGFRMMLIYYPNMFKEGRLYTYCGNYDWNNAFPHQLDDLKPMLDKIKAAGITPGFHFLHTHIGVGSRYVTPVADHRLNLTRHFTLARPLGEEDTTVYVEENPLESTTHPKCRVLRFGGEMIAYEGYTTEWPYCFTGCTRGHFDTQVTTHPLGQIGGIADISEFGAVSLYVDQRTSLQDEIASKLAEVYNTGFAFVYFDGSEGTNPPFDIYIPYAQYRVYKQLKNPPLFCEGAAKSHFSWHMLSGGNAFDVFPTSIFKKMIAKHPLEEAARMQDDFTRVNFGWWRFFPDSQPDVFEYGTSKAAAYDCPATLRADITAFKNHPRIDDILKVIRRWEDVRQRQWLTAEQKECLKDPDTEYTLLLNGNGDYELVPYTPIERQDDIAVFTFTRGDRRWAVLWHKTGSEQITLPLADPTLTCRRDLDGDDLPVTVTAEGVTLTVEGKIYLSTALSECDLQNAFRT